MLLRLCKRINRSNLENYQVMIGMDNAEMKDLNAKFVLEARETIFTRTISEYALASFSNLAFRQNPQLAYQFASSPIAANTHVIHYSMQRQGLYTLNVRRIQTFWCVKGVNVKGWHNRGYDGTPTVEANMWKFGYLAKGLFRGDSYITAIWTAKVISTVSDMGQFHLTVQSADTAELYWDEVRAITCQDDCLSSSITIGTNEVHSVTIKYYHPPGASDPGYTLSWTGNPSMLANAYSCAYPIYQQKQVFLLSRNAPVLSNSYLTYYDSAANTYVNSAIELVAGGTYTFVLLLRDAVGNIRFDYTQSTFPWMCSIANEGGNTVFDSLSGTHRIQYSPKVAGTGTISVGSTLNLPVSVSPGSGKDYIVSVAKSLIKGPSNCPVSQVCSYAISLQDAWGNLVTSSDTGSLYAALLFNGSRKQLSVHNSANTSPYVEVNSLVTGSFQLEVLYFHTPLINSRVVSYSFTL